MQETSSPAAAQLTLDQALSLAQQHFEAGQIQQAAGLCQQILQAVPHQTDALHLLGMAAHCLGKNDIAVNLIARAIEIQPAASYYHSLGIVLHGLGRLEDTERSYRSALELQPVYPEAHYHLGLLQQQRSQLEPAMLSYRSALKARPEFAQAHNNLGNVLKELTRFNEAAASYREALRLSPDLVEAHNNLGIVLQWQGDLTQAEACYRAALQRNPDFVEAYVQLGSVLQMLGQPDAAIAAYDAALGLDPACENALHHANALRQVTTEKAPPGYVRSLFDGLAPNFDHHLVNTLDYHIPEKLSKAIIDLLHPAPHSLDVIDLGCGTGLAGQQMHAFSRQMSGVDLSARMIEQARAKNLYSNLVVGDLHEYLSGLPDASADLVVAADVIIYVGDLSELFSQARRVLRVGGTFAFTLEEGATDADYRLQPNGRYQHSQDYAHRLATEDGMQEVLWRPVMVRREAGQPVEGFLCLFRLPLAA